MARWFAHAVALAVALAGPVGGQEVVDALPPEFTDQKPETWLSDGEKASDPWWRERVAERFRLELAEGRYSVILRRLCEDFRALPKSSATELPARFQAQMELVTASFERSVAAVGLTDGLEDAHQRSLVDQKMQAEGFGVQSLEPQWLAPDGMIFLLFYFAESEEDPGIPSAEVTPEGKFRLLIPRAEMRRMRLVSDAFRFVLGHFIAPVQDAQLEALRAAERRWNGYLFEGYSQYPWEALFNGWVLDFSTFEPPDEQWILLHPSIGFEASTVSLDEIQADEVLNVELLGYLRYFDDNQGYLGASLTVVLRDELNPGFGLMAHWSNEIFLGVAWHDLDDDDDYFDDDPFVLLSVDLFHYAQSEGRAFKEKYDELRGLLGR